MLAVDDAEDGGLLLGSAVDAGGEEARRRLEAVHDAAREVGVFGGALGKAGVRELDQDGILAAEEEDGLFGDLAEVDWISNGLEDDDGDVELLLLIQIAGGGLAGDGTGHGCYYCC